MGRCRERGERRCWTTAIHRAIHRASFISSTFPLSSIFSLLVPLPGPNRNIIYIYGRYNAAQFPYLDLSHHLFSSFPLVPPYTEERKISLPFIHPLEKGPTRRKFDLRLSVIARRTIHDTQSRTVTHLLHGCDFHVINPIFSVVNSPIFMFACNCICNST